jgi:hypothetical protein
MRRPATEPGPNEGQSVSGGGTEKTMLPPSPLCDVVLRRSCSARDPSSLLETHADAASSQADAELHVFNKIVCRQLSLGKDLPRERHSGPKQRNSSADSLEPARSHEVFYEHSEVGHQHQRRGVFARDKQVDRLRWFLSEQHTGGEPFGTSGGELAVSVDDDDSVGRIRLKEVSAEGQCVAFSASAAVLPLNYLYARLSRQFRCLVSAVVGDHKDRPARGNGLPQTANCRDDSRLLIMRWHEDGRPAVR